MNKKNLILNNRHKVLCLGIAVADTYAKSIDKIPKWHTLATFDDVKFAPGGCAINTAINLKNLGLYSGVAAAGALPEPLKPTSSPSCGLYKQNMSPPTLVDWGSTTHWVATAAIAASRALPPCIRIWIAVAVDRGLDVAAIPFFE